MKALNAENRTFSGIPNGWTDAYPYLTRTYTVTINAIDPSNDTATGMFNIHLGGAHWTTLITALTVVLGTMATSYAYAQKKHLLWDFFKKSKYRKPLELLTLGDTTFSHEITFPAQRIKSITVTLTQERACAKVLCCKKTLGFFPLVGNALNDSQVRVFPCTSTYLFPWLFYDAETNTLKSVKGGPTEEFIGKDIKIQIRGTDNRIMEEFHIAVGGPQREYVADSVGGAHRNSTLFARREPLVAASSAAVREMQESRATTKHGASAGLSIPLLAPTADVS